MSCGIRVGAVSWSFIIEDCTWGGVTSSATVAACTASIAALVDGNALGVFAGCSVPFPFVSGVEGEGLNVLAVSSVPVATGCATIDFFVMASRLGESTGMRTRTSTIDATALAITGSLSLAAGFRPFARHANGPKRKRKNFIRRVETCRSQQRRATHRIERGPYRHLLLPGLRVRPHGLRVRLLRCGARIGWPARRLVAVGATEHLEDLECIGGSFLVLSAPLPWRAAVKRASTCRRRASTTSAPSSSRARCRASDLRRDDVPGTTAAGYCHWGAARHRSRRPTLGLALPCAARRGRLLLLAAAFSFLGRPRGSRTTAGVTPPRRRPIRRCLPVAPSRPRVRRAHQQRLSCRPALHCRQRGGRACVILRRARGRSVARGFPRPPVVQGDCIGDDCDAGLIA